MMAKRKPLGQHLSPAQDALVLLELVEGDLSIEVTHVSDLDAKPPGLDERETFNKKRHSKTIIVLQFLQVFDVGRSYPQIGISCFMLG